MVDYKLLSTPLLEFDGWDCPLKCVKCGRQDNHDKYEPVTYLDVKTKLCEFCFLEVYNE